MVLLLLALTLAYAYPVRVYLSQRGEIDQLEASQAEQRQRIQDLKDQLARWDDPNYVITQSRLRLHMIRPGELLFVVKADQEADAPADEPADSSWSSQLWANLQAADDPTAP